MEKRLKILVVDDEEIVRRSIKLVLEQEYEIIEAESITESMALFDKENPDLILLDIFLPGIDGMQGLLHFRMRSITIPVILISGQATFKLAQQALRLGATDYLTKPFTHVELLQTIQHALEASGAAETTASSAPPAEFKLHLSLEDLGEDKFLSIKHRSHFLAFAQNVLSGKARNFEDVTIADLIKTVTLQFEALRPEERVACDMPAAAANQHLHCDMYLLGGTLANLAFACMLETRDYPKPFALKVGIVDNTLCLVYLKEGAKLPQEFIEHFETWHEQRGTGMDANTASLILARFAIGQHQGELALNPSEEAGPLLEIRLPLSSRIK